MPDKKFVTIVRNIICAVSCCIAIYLFTIFISVNNVSKDVESYCKKAMEKGYHEIVVCNYTDTEYFYLGWADITFMFDYYYEEPGDISFIEIDPYTWKHEYYEKNNYEIDPSLK